MSIAIPRIRDFRGLNARSFDGRGNYSMGIREQIIFPEIDYDSIDQVRGLDVTITTSARTDEEAFALLEAFGMPFSEEGRPGSAAADTAAQEAEDERRKGEARARAEAEQAALEQLKEENPEAYEKPAEPEEGETARDGERARWPRPRRGCGPARPQKYKTRNYTRCRRCGRARAVFRKFGICRICLRELAHQGFMPGMTKSSW